MSALLKDILAVVGWYRRCCVRIGICDDEDLVFCKEDDVSTMVLFEVVNNCRKVWVARSGAACIAVEGRSAAGARKDTGQMRKLVVDTVYPGSIRVVVYLLETFQCV